MRNRDALARPASNRQRSPHDLAIASGVGSGAYVPFTARDGRVSEALCWRETTGTPSPSYHAVQGAGDVLANPAARTATVS